MPGVTTPRPDYIYGIRGDQFEPPKGVVPSDGTQRNLDVAGPAIGLYVPYFVWKVSRSKD